MGSTYSALVPRGRRQERPPPTRVEIGTLDSLVDDCACAANLVDGRLASAIACGPRCLPSILRSRCAFAVLFYKPIIDRAPFPEPN